MTFVSTIRLTHNPGTTFSTDRQIIQKSCHKKLSHFFLQCRSCPFFAFVVVIIIVVVYVE